MAGCKIFLSSNLMSLKTFFFFFLNCMSASAQLQAPFYLKFYLKSVNLISSLACGYTTRNICGSFAEQMLQHYAPAIINKTGYSGLLLCSQSTQSSCVCVSSPFTQKWVIKQWFLYFFAKWNCRYTLSDFSVCVCFASTSWHFLRNVIPYIISCSLLKRFSEKILDPKSWKCNTIWKFFNF